MGSFSINTERYARCMENARKINWDIDRDVIRFRTLDNRQKYMPDGLSKVNDLESLSEAEKIFLSQVQGRTYAYIFGLAERFINAKILEVGASHALGNQTALAAMVQFSQEELKHQELFRRVEELAQASLPPGYEMTADPNAVAEAVLSKSTWAVLALTCHIEIFTLVHYKMSIKDDDKLSALFKDVFRFHWMEESQHAVLDELEWDRVHHDMSDDEVDLGVNDLIELVTAVDGILQAQSKADARYFVTNCQREFSREQTQEIETLILKAYRWQYIVSGVQVERFQQALLEKVSPSQADRIMAAMQPILEFVGE